MHKHQYPHIFLTLKLVSGLFHNMRATGRITVALQFVARNVWGCVTQVFGMTRSHLDRIELGYKLMLCLCLEVGKFSEWQFLMNSRSVRYQVVVLDQTEMT